MRELVLTRESLTKALENLNNYPAIGLDTESSGPDLLFLRGKHRMINLYKSELAGVSWSYPDGRSFYLPLRHATGTNAPFELFYQLIHALMDYLGVVYIHNLKHEVAVLRREGPTAAHLANIWEASAMMGRPNTAKCTLVLMWLLQRKSSDDHHPYGLKYLASTYLLKDRKSFKELFGDRQMCDVPSHEVLDYGCEDSEDALALGMRFDPELDQFLGMRTTYDTIETPFIYVVRDMEDSGVDLDTGVIHRYLDQFNLDLGPLESDWDFLSDGLNMRSAVQLQSLYETGVWTTEGVERTKGGLWSTDHDSMEIQLANLPTSSMGYQLAAVKLACTLLTKLSSTYGMNLAQIAGQYPDCRLHPSTNQTGTDTGRLSTNYPSIQNIPVRTKEGKEIRKAFIAPLGYRLVSADYSQIELRVLAHFAKAGAHFDGFHKGLDAHQAVADSMGVSRDAGKTGNFAVVYGAGAKKVARSLRIELDAAKKFLADLKHANPEIFETLDAALRAARQRGYVRTLSHRIRRLDLNTKKSAMDALKDQGYNYNNSPAYRLAWYELGEEERKAKNTPIQGGAADVVKLGMLKFYRTVDRNRCKMIMQIHDDIISRVENDYVAECKLIKQECLETAYPLRVPLLAKPVDGQNWSELK